MHYVIWARAYVNENWNKTDVGTACYLEPSGSWSYEVKSN